MEPRAPGKGSSARILVHAEKVQSRITAQVSAAYRSAAVADMGGYIYSSRLGQREGEPKKGCCSVFSWEASRRALTDEAVSWGKFVPLEEGGRLAEVFDDATVALPLVAGAVLERIGYFDNK